MIAGLGAAMVALAALTWLRRPLLFGAAALLTVLHKRLRGAIAPASTLYPLCAWYGEVKASRSNRLLKLL